MLRPDERNGYDLTKETVTHRHVFLFSIFKLMLLNNDQSSAEFCTNVCNTP